MVKNCWSLVYSVAHSQYKNDLTALGDWHLSVLLKGTSTVTDAIQASTTHPFAHSFFLSCLPSLYTQPQLIFWLKGCSFSFIHSSCFFTPNPNWMCHKRASVTTTVRLFSIRMPWVEASNAALQSATSWAERLSDTCFYLSLWLTIKVLRHGWGAVDLLSLNEELHIGFLLI